jgi:hypothetical protein
VQRSSNCATTRGKIEPSRSIAPTFSPSTTLTYPTMAQRLAIDAHKPSALERRIAREQAIQDAIRVLAGRFLLSVADLTDGERQYLTDLRRQDPRYKHLNIVRMIDLSNRSTSASDRQHFGELVRAQTYCDAPVPDVPEAIDAEVAAHAKASVAVREFERHPCNATREAAITAERELLATERTELDALEQSRVA